MADQKHGSNGKANANHASVRGSSNMASTGSASSSRENNAVGLSADRDQPFSDDSGSPPLNQRRQLSQFSRSRGVAQALVDECAGASSSSQCDSFSANVGLCDSYLVSAAANSNECQELPSGPMLTQSSALHAEAKNAIPPANSSESDIDVPRGEVDTACNVRPELEAAAGCTVLPRTSNGSHCDANEDRDDSDVGQLDDDIDNHSDAEIASSNPQKYDEREHLQRDHYAMYFDEQNDNFIVENDEDLLDDHAAMDDEALTNQPLDLADASAYDDAVDLSDGALEPCVENDAENDYVKDSSSNDASISFGANTKVHNAAQICNVSNALFLTGAGAFQRSERSGHDNNNASFQQRASAGSSTAYASSSVGSKAAASASAASSSYNANASNNNAGTSAGSGSGNASFIQAFPLSASSGQLAAMPQPNFSAAVKYAQSASGGAGFAFGGVSAKRRQGVVDGQASGASSSSYNANDAPPLNVAAVARGAVVGSPNNPLHNWQATKHTLKERFSFMFNNEILADVHFIVGRGDQRQRIPAHKFVLSVGSAVFDTMFNGAMAASDINDIDLPDVEPAAFLALLKFLYSDDVQIGPDIVMTVLYTAKKYAVPALELSCVEFLKRHLSPDNAFMLLTQARLFDEPQLAALCLEMIDKHTQEAISAEGFTDIDLETLCAVLERDTLRIREVALYQAVVRWSTEECHRQQLPVTPENQRQALGRAMQLIRFPLMFVEEFAQSAAQSGILSDREVVNLFLYFTVNPKPQIGFLDVPRCCVTGKEQVVNRFQRIEGRWGYSGTPDRIKFTVDRRIFVVGFGLFGSIHGPTEYSVNIQIIHCGSGKIIGSNDTAFQCDGTSATFRVMFKEPVEISPCITYIASATLKGPDSHYGTKGLRRMVHQSPGAGCVTFQFTYAAGNNNGTSVEDGQIPEIIFYTKLS